MRKIIFYAVVLILIPVLPAANADESKEAGRWYDKISPGGELRLRQESQIDYGALTGGVDDDTFVLLRARPHLEARPVDGVRIFLQPQFSRIFAQEESTIAGNADAGNANNVFDLHQGYIDLDRIAGSRVSLRVGRQELSYGDERLVGAFGWSNIGRSFDAGKIRLGWNSFWIDGLFAWNERGAGNEYLSGLYGSWKAAPNLTEEAYVFYLRDNDGDGVAGVTGLDLITIGDRLVGTFLDQKIDYGIEAALQMGKTQPNSHLAYAAHASGGYTFQTKWKPRLGLEYNFASGNDPATARMERFHNLFPTNHNKYGFIDFVSWRNIHDAGPSFRIKPFDGAQFEAAYHLFLLPEPTDGLFRASGAQLRGGAAGASGVAGHEVDIAGQYQWKKYLNVLVGYSLFRGGSFFDDTGANDAAHFAYSQISASF